MTIIPWGAKAAAGAAFSLAFFSCLSSTDLRAGNRASPTLNDQVFQREAAGDLRGARSLLEQEASTPGNSLASRDLALFLERHGDPESRQAYRKWAGEEQDPSVRKLALRELVLLDFMEGNNTALQDDLARYRSAGGDDLTPPPPNSKPQYSTITIPGPFGSFARMAALSPDMPPQDLLPALARNVVTNGYEASGNELLQQTEYMRLLVRYIGQARELQALATKSKIVIPTCDSDATGALLKILGYRMRGSCGGDLVLETVNATRAFLTVDSAFPISELEQDLRANHPFELPYASTPVPVLYTAQYWMAALGRSSQGGDFIDAFLADPSLARLYLGLSHLDRATAEALRSQSSPAKLKVYAHVLDFFGSMFRVQNGAAVVPGSPKVWATLVGVPPSNPGAFFSKLIATDDGWLASYFDALSRTRGQTATYLTQPERMKRCYDALRGKITSPGPARPVFRSSTELMLLTTSLYVDPNGQAHVPGDLDVWRNLFIHHPNGKYDGRLTRSAATWRTSDDLIEALFALSRKSVENEPLKIFLALNDIDRHRAKPISPELAAALVSSYRAYGSQYAVFADAPNLSEASIQHYLDLMSETAGIRDVLLKADTLGSVQSAVELWRILCRQGSIAPDAQDTSFAKLIEPFRRAKGGAELFDADRAAIGSLLASAGVTGKLSPQESLTELLVGKIHAAPNVPNSPAENFMRIFDAQRLISLDALFAAADHFGKGPVDPKLMKNLTEQLSRLEEAETVRGSLSAPERSAYVPGYWSERHMAQERKTNFDSLAKGNEKKDVKATLVPFLRDSLVGILYSYYAPDGAQLLLANPLFVRSHDFIGPDGSPAIWRATQVSGTGWPESGGGRLSGSLISLPYTIAEAEQNFLTPKREQALIWGDLVPQMIVDVTVNRWRNVTPQQVRWVGLHMQRGETLLAAAAMNSEVESKVMDVLRRYETPGDAERIDDRLRSADFAHALGQLPPSVLYSLAEDSSLKNVSPDLPSMEISEMAAKGDPELLPASISRAFGTPKPTLTHSYLPGLLYLRTFPALMGYSSRIMAETWESNNLYYAALADRVGVPVSQLDIYVPDWNRAAIENIFATHLEDWPALLRSLKAVSGSVTQSGNQGVTEASSSLN